jgi:hypothetical protein
MPSVPRHQRRFDVAGCISVTLGSCLLVTALVQGPQWGWLDGRTLAWCCWLAGAGGISLPLKDRWPRR